MANRFTTLQLELPCKLSEATEWWEEVGRVIDTGVPDAVLSVIDHTDGHHRLTVHLAEET